MPATSPCSNSAFKSSHSVLKMTSGIDASTPRSDFRSWSSMKESRSQFRLESYKNWDFRVGSSYRNYLNNPRNKINSWLSRDTPAFDERPFHSDSGEKPIASPKALEKATFSCRQTTALMKTLAVGIQDTQKLRQQHDECGTTQPALFWSMFQMPQAHGEGLYQRAPDTADVERLFFTRQTARGQGNPQTSTGTGQHVDGKLTSPFQPDFSTRRHGIEEESAPTYCALIQKHLTGLSRAALGTIAR